MYRPAAPSTDAATEIRERLAGHGYSRRQANLLEGLYGLCADEFNHRLDQMLDELEQQLFRSAEQARSNEVQKVLLEAQQRIHERRAQLKPNFLAGLQVALVTLVEPPAVETERSSEPRFSELSLVETDAMDETVALKEMATRCETRNSLALFLLGQRMGVLARAPAFDAENLPLGPRRLCRVLRTAVLCFDFDVEQRGLVYRQFDRSVLNNLTPLWEVLNNYLIGQGVLPHLTYVTPRSAGQGRRQPQEPQEPSPRSTPTRGLTAPPMRTGTSSTKGPPARAGGAFASHAAAAAPVTEGAPSPAARHAGVFPPARKGRSAPSSASMETAEPQLEVRQAALEEPQILPWTPTAAPDADAGGEVELFETLRRLLSGRRGLLDRLKPVDSAAPKATPAQVQQGLEHIQRRYNAQAGGSTVLPVAAIKRDLLAHLRQQAPGAAAPQLPTEQGDTVDLVGMLFEQIAQEVRPQSTGGHLLAQLQLPLLRVALQDTGFFTDHQHPARRLLEVVAETSAHWGNEDEIDRDLIDKMSTAVQRANEEPSIDPTLFNNLVSNLTTHLSTQQRKAEISERRHVEAARGREKLEIARLKAEEAIEQLLAGKTVPKFLQTLLEEAWIDVLALALLRGGEQAPAFRQHLALAEGLVAASIPNATATPIDAVAAARMREEITAALAQIGYAQHDANEIGTRLLAVTAAMATGKPDVAADADADAEPVAGTGLTAKLRSRDRLGQDVQKGHAGTAHKGERAAPLSEPEQIWHDRLKRLPYGTWFEFTINQQGDKARRRMSWFSTVTDNCVFVNFRGQRAGDYTLAWLARELNRGNVTLVESERASIVDRAWKAILTTLRSFSRTGADTNAATA